MRHVVVVRARRGRAVLPIVIGVVVVGLLLCGGAGYLWERSIWQAREAVSRNNLKLIALALFEYHAQYGEFPPAYVADAEGKPMHSWRTLLLPFLFEEYLYDEYDWEQPWNSPQNKALCEMPLFSYEDPLRGYNNDSLTTYKMIVSDPPASPPNAVAIVVADYSDPVPWYQPDDISVNDFVNGTMFEDAPYPRVMVVLANGDVEFTQLEDKQQRKDWLPKPVED